ncbi:transcription initiation factor TFIID subunit 13-like [Dorcoceras hygrometricum]|uniref:Transcription initiation factor TFIID subunit 13 n=1 Tax=Dorcoceras hygrometricum TaxID=472368 RepID=A0A2Z7CBU6_9LAMI|nr:transcription initiation factor TFIID subunit 13-like [Dorcoceras hygrometricum]
MNNSASVPSSKVRVGSSQPAESSFKRKRGMFQKDLQHMMYGFGDDSNPLPETVALVEDIVVDSFDKQSDTPKLNRCTELLSMNEELKQARKAFEVDEEKLASVD